jgi:hypothetical protein
MTGDGSSTNDHFSCRIGDRKRSSERDYIPKLPSNQLDEEPIDAAMSAIDRNRTNGSSFEGINPRLAQKPATSMSTALTINARPPRPWPLATFGDNLTIAVGQGGAKSDWRGMRRLSWGLRSFPQHAPSIAESRCA